MNNNPLISFVVPVLNRVEWIAECLGSLLAQSISNIEVIAVNDGSTDGTGELLDDHFILDPRVRVIHNEKNIGAGLSRNAGNKIARAPIIGVCDSDDAYPVERAERILRFFDKYPEGVLMNAPYVRVGYNNEPLEPFDGEPFDEKAFKKDGSINFFCHPAAAYLKKDIDQVGGYKAENKDMTDDVQLVCDWIKAGKKIGFMAGEYLCLHRVLSDSMMAKHRGWRPEWAVQ